MLTKPIECIGCPLENIGRGFSIPEGIGSIPLLICGESLGYNEMLEGLPFRPNAQAGSILHRVINRARINRNSLAFWNMCGCQPPGDKLSGTYYEYSAINHCRIHFDRVIARYNPKIILALGGLPFKHLTGLSGHKLNITDIRGYVFQSTRYPNCLVIGSLHPSYIRRNNIHLMPLLMQDLLKAMYIAQDKDIPYILDPKTDTTLDYILHPTIEQIKDFYLQCRSNPYLPVALDVENPKSANVDEEEREMTDQTITQIQFSNRVGSGIAIKWNQDTYEIIKDICELSNPKVNHNLWLYDRLVLRKHGIELSGEQFDTQWMAHHHQADLPIGLQAVASWFHNVGRYAWKHLNGSDFELYGITDADNALGLYHALKEALEKRNLWGEYNIDHNRYTGYYGLVQGFEPILIDMAKQGLLVNQSKQELFAQDIEQRKIDILEELKRYISSSFVRFNKQEGYIREPKEVKNAKVKYMIEAGTTVIDVPEEYITRETGFVLREFIIGKDLTEEQEELIRLGVTFNNKEVKIEKRWVKLLDFNPNSSDQISNYIKYNNHEDLARKLTIRIIKEYKNKEDVEDKKGKDNVSTSKALLKKLGEKTGNKAYSLIVEYKELSKMKGTYIDGYKPREDGRIHTTYTFRPATMQTSSRNPNVQNSPQHSILAKRFKETIEAPEGYLFLKFDYKSYHAKMLGFLAEDKDYIRLSSIDPHSYVAAHMANLPEANECIVWDDNRLSTFLLKVKKEYKSLRDDQAKHAILGIGFLLTEVGCYERYKDDFNPKEEDILSTWSRRRKNPYDINDRTDQTYLQQEIERIGKAKVKTLYDLLKRLFPQIFTWQTRTIMDADTKGYIQTLYGTRRWFLAASEIKYDKFGNVSDIKRGMQAEDAVAFPVACNAFCHLREGLIIMEQKGLLRKYRLNNMVHDDIRFEVKEDMIKECIEEIKPILERKSTTLTNASMLEGFWCQADVSIGKNLLFDMEI
jgi:uracil-DNA glycosylase family 4